MLMIIHATPGFFEYTLKWIDCPTYLRYSDPDFQSFKKGSG